MQLRRNLIVWSMIWVVLLSWGVIGTAQDTELPTSTPVQVRIESPTPIPTIANESVNQGNSGLSIQAEAPVLQQEQVLLEPISDVNVRSSPEIAEDNRIGTIRQGERFVVLGRYFNWVQFQYDRVPSNRAWVYQDLVTIIGSLDNVPVLELNPTETVDPSLIQATQTREAVLDAPGGFLTVTAQARIIDIPATNPASQELFLPADVNTPKPTFTYPPNLASNTNNTVMLDSAGNETVNTGGAGDVSSVTASPLFAILALGFLGFMGLLYTASR